MSEHQEERARPKLQQNVEPATAFFLVLGVYLFWGLLPIFFKAVAHVSPVEVVLHRSVWSLPVAGLAIVLLRRTADLKVALRTPRTLAMAVLTSMIIAFNWGLYVWAVASDRLVEAALGYYINPLVNVAAGGLLLGERLTRAQYFAVGLAVVAVLFLTVSEGVLPWLSLLLALSFSAYGFLRKTLPIGPTQGFFLEVLILSGPALAAMVWWEMSGRGHFSPADPVTAGLLLASGPLTAIPLLMFGAGARVLRFTTIGLMQYITPTMIFVLAVTVFDEPFDRVRALTFALIWTALAIYTGSVLRARQQGRA